jgi:hypothetical protein
VTYVVLGSIVLALIVRAVKQRKSDKNDSDGGAPKPAAAS